MTDNKEYFMALIKEDPEKAYELYAGTREERDELSRVLTNQRKTYWKLVKNIKLALNANEDLEDLINALLNNQKEEKE